MKPARNTSVAIDVLGTVKFQLSSLHDPDLSAMPENSNFVKHHEYISSMIRRTVTLAESNSVLIVGPRGCGKTALLNTVIKLLKTDPAVTENLLVVRLNGILHTDDRIALKDFACQLKLEEENVEMFDSEFTGTFAEAFTVILNALREERKQKCSILVCLEEFQLFCTHKSQTLLYNLFDVAQSAQTPIAVVGLTSRLDIIELMEKRVKSRFSHRQILLHHPKVLEDNIDSVRALLTIPPLDNGWNKSVERLLKDKKVVKTFKQWFDVACNYRTLKQKLLVAVTRLTEHRPFLDADDIREVFNTEVPEGKTNVLNGLSVLELILVVCILNYTSHWEVEDFNFHVIYLDFKKATKVWAMPEMPINVIQKAFQRLEQVEVIQLRQSKSGLQNEYRPMRLLVEAQHIEACIKEYPNLPASLKQFATEALRGSS